MNFALKKSVGGFGKKIVTPTNEGDASSKSPWCSINDMLIQNRCWLCALPFARGTQKKVFQVSHLVDFFNEIFFTRSAQELQNDGKQILNGQEQSGSVTSNESIAVTNAAGESGHIAESNDSNVLHTLQSFKSKNLLNCYNNYCSLMSGGSGSGSKELARIFKHNDIEMWMSGLVCNATADCNEELMLFLSGVSKRDNSNAVEESLNSLRTAKDCPPNCGCDNPWNFLA